MSNLRACIVGSGPAGLLTAKYISKFLPVTIFEKSNKILGNYNYSSEIKKAMYDKILENDAINIHFNRSFQEKDQKDCDLIIMATGGVAKPPLKGTKSAFQMIKNHFDNKKINIGRNICIIGMGNVTMDLLNILNQKVDSVTVLSRSNLFNSKFDNSKIRDLLGKYEIFPINSQLNTFKYQNTTKNDIFSRKDITRKSIFNNLPKNPELPKLNLIFEASIEEIVDKNNKKQIKYKINNSEFITEVFDDVISSIGFAPNNLNIVTNKPTYKIGWCKNPVGDISDLSVEAQVLADKIQKEFNNQ
ncbi:fdxr [Nucleospora cyclopteri]